MQMAEIPVGPVKGPVGTGFPYETLITAKLSQDRAAYEKEQFFFGSSNPGAFIFSHVARVGQACCSGVRLLALCFCFVKEFLMSAAV